MRMRSGRLHFPSQALRGWNLRAMVAWGALGIAAGPTFLDLKGMTGRRPGPPTLAVPMTSPREGAEPGKSGTNRAAAAQEQIDPIARAKQAICECRSRFRPLYPPSRNEATRRPSHAKACHGDDREPSRRASISTPRRTAERPFIKGRHDGRVLAHDVGLGKWIAGTMRLDPQGSMAMGASRHPITDAGIGPLIETVAQRWADELTPDESLVTFHAAVLIDNRPCMMIESIHPRRQPGFLFHKVKLYIDRELGLPTRFEAYDWPRHEGASPELVEEYSYRAVRTDVGLRDEDFDPANKGYSFGRF
ncbi:MAG: DUF1571 domain-containing protein [Singulisphaera sp.]